MKFRKEMSLAVQLTSGEEVHFEARRMLTKEYNELKELALQAAAGDVVEEIETIGKYITSIEGETDLSEIPLDVLLQCFKTYMDFTIGSEPVELRPKPSKTPKRRKA